VKTIRNLFFGLVTIIAIVFAVANRAPLTLDLWPFPFALETTAGIAILTGVAVGIIVGMVGHALGRAGTRRRKTPQSGKTVPSAAALENNRNTPALPGR